MRLPATATRADQTNGARHEILLPSVRTLVVRAGRYLMEATVVPLGLFYGVLSLLGLHWALGTALAWSYAAIIRRLVRREPVPGILLLGTLLFTGRTVISLVTGSVFLYFLQPTLGTYLVAGIFLLSVPLGRPLAARLAHDFFPLPDSLARHEVMHRFFLRISLLWALVYITNATATLWLLLTSSVGNFLVFKSVASVVLTAGAVALSYLWFRRSLRDHGVVLRWAKHAA